jgi:hypothetical protein
MGKDQSFQRKTAHLDSCEVHKHFVFEILLVD